jgi:ABC-type taurine transport system ATPase subunit
LLKVVLGLLPLSAGTITVDGRPPGRGNPEAGYVAQQRVFDRDLSIRGRDLVQFGVDGHRLGLPRTRPRQVASVIAAVGAQAYADAPIGLLSGGQQQRLSANPLIVLGLSVLAAVAADGGLLASFQSNVKASVLITSLSFAIYVAARLAGPLLRDRRRRQHPPQNPPSREAGGFTAGSSTAGRRRPRPTPTLLRDTGREPRGTGRSRG